MTCVTDERGLLHSFGYVLFRLRTKCTGSSQSVGFLDEGEIFTDYKEAPMYVSHERKLLARHDASEMRHDTGMLVRLDSRERSALVLPGPLVD